MNTTTALESQRKPAVELLANELLTADEFADVLEVSKRTLFRLRAKKIIPEPVSISTNIIRWRARDVRAYLESLMPRRLQRLS